MSPTPSPPRLVEPGRFLRYHPEAHLDQQDGRGEPDDNPAAPDAGGNEQTMAARLVASRPDNPAPANPTARQPLPVGLFGAAGARKR